MNLDSKIYVAGHSGMVGSAVVRNLNKQGYNNIITKTKDELDLTRQKDVEEFFAETKPEYVLMAAAIVGGIHANDAYSAEFIYNNITIASNAIHASYLNNVKKFLFLGSSCIYPKHADQPITEDSLLTSYLEKTNEAYAIAKIAGLKMCQHYKKQYGVNYHSVMPTNLYGTGDNYHPQNSHVLPSLIRRVHEAKVSNSPTITVWGTGKAMREFLYVDDLAEALIIALNMENPPDWMNIGYGSDITIKELIATISKVIGYSGELVWDTSKPDGTPRKLMDSSLFRNATGWTPKINLEIGIKIAYDDFLINEKYLSNS